MHWRKHDDLEYLDNRYVWVSNGTNIWIGSLADNLKLKTGDQWMPMEYPKLPEINKNIHDCIDTNLKYQCIQEDGSKMIFSSTENSYKTEVRFCPICGYDANAPKPS